MYFHWTKRLQRCSWVFCQSHLSHDHHTGSHLSCNKQYSRRSPKIKQKAVTLANPFLTYSRSALVKADVPCLSHLKENYFPITLFFIIVLHSQNTCKDFSKYNSLTTNSTASWRQQESYRYIWILPSLKMPTANCPATDLSVWQQTIWKWET